MNKKFVKHILSFLILLVLFTPVLALAQSTFNTNDTFGTGTIKDINVPSDTEDLPSIVVNVINIVLGLLALIAIVIILIGGFEWMTAGGNEEQVKTAQSRLKYGLIGLVIVFLAYGIATWVLTTLDDIGRIQR